MRCITFDLDDTLWAIGPVIARAQALAWQWLATHRPRVAERFDEADLEADRRRYFDDRPDLHHDLWRLRRGWMTDLVRRAGYPDPDLGELFTLFWRERNRVVFYDGAVAALADTARRFTVGAITNGNADLEQVGIRGHFDFFLTAAEVGAGKPDARIFGAAIAAAGCDPGDIVHVGDDPERDVRGAARAGMRTVWINPAGRPWEGDCAPDATIAAVAALPGALRDLAPGPVRRPRGNGPTT